MLTDVLTYSDLLTYRIICYISNVSNFEYVHSLEVRTVKKKGENILGLFGKLVKDNVMNTRVTHLTRGFNLTQYTSFYFKRSNDNKERH